ncbi:hypothetical protein SADUNF_Sadunf10G0067300 [Salix dunnii]|uniref:Protein kinase domain-containing protein n=1 Tax=Salix dunnii TaxID=1413687 RepID=A0A835JQP6_9ROSI|nr:hypothetical protein SADUNF_Sadunf10G0067300 [Salix dunnii]
MVSKYQTSKPIFFSVPLSLSHFASSLFFNYKWALRKSSFPSSSLLAPSTITPPSLTVFKLRGTFFSSLTDMGVQALWAVFLVLGFLMFQAQVMQSQNQACKQSDLKALREFMRGLQSPIQGRGTNISSPLDCCNWLGITCYSSSSLGLVNDSVNSGRVTKLELARQRLVGKLVESVGSLDQLRTLNLSHNFLKDSLPFSLFHLPKLEVLDLSFNYFTGSIPQSINLPSVIFFDISSNSIHGSLPTRICQNSSRIQFLDLAVNYFSGILSPGLGDCTTLEHLCLGMNDLVGGISEDIFQLKKLKLLDLQENNFSGNLSTGIGKLLSLERLDISSNNFSGTIPDVFRSLSKLKNFLGRSNYFVGRIPISLANSPSLNLLNLRNNSLGGIIDLNCSSMTNLSILDLATNSFSGNVPSYLPACKNLKNINLAKNKFTGKIPESFKDFQVLSYLSLSNCSITSLSSALRILQQCKSLMTLVLTLNFQSEALPADPTLHFENLKVLVIANCRLTGSIPQWLSNSSKLQLVDLSWNNLSGTIPSWFGGFASLFYLDLSNNSFSGEIPRNLTGLPSLISSSISVEEPSPYFPLFQSRNERGRGLQYNQVWSFPPTLALSDNFLTGPIWPEFGNLTRLHDFKLKSNRLSGTIPSELSRMTSLETLDLSHNNLSGVIPWSLVNLSFLSEFSVAYNQLRGKIPDGSQFMTFPNSSFVGNHLCGDHGTPPCPKSDGFPLESSRKSGRNKYTIRMAVGVVFGTASLLVLVIMIVLRAHSRGLILKRWMQTHDKEADELGTRLVVLMQSKEDYMDLSLEDLLKSTNNFDQENIIGCGGFGLVYRAALPDGRKLAIKRLSGDCGQMDREFRAEVEALSKAQHPNLVHLQGIFSFEPCMPSDLGLRDLASDEWDIGGRTVKLLNQSTFCLEIRGKKKKKKGALRGNLNTDAGVGSSGESTHHMTGECSHCTVR